MTLAAAWRRGQEGWPREYVLAQFPNAPLLLWIAASLLRRVLSGDAADIAEAVATVGLTAWAWLELTAGVNAFRRTIGAVALIAIVLGSAS